MSTNKNCKYKGFRDHYRFVKVMHNDPVTTNEACACCCGRQNDQFISQFIVTETRLNEPYKLGETVEKLICTKCLQYTYGQRMSMYKTNKRQQQYKAKFKVLYEWCLLNTSACEVYPTLKRFFDCCNSGDSFKPKLVEHVSKLIGMLRENPVLLEFADLYVRTPVRPAWMQQLRFDIDECKPVNYEQIKQFLAS